MAEKTRRTIDQRFRNMTERQLSDYIKTQGKVANQRLRSLEGKAKTTTTNPVTGKKEKVSTQNLTESSNAYIYTIQKAKLLEERGESGRIYSRTGKGEVKFTTATQNFDVATLRERATAISKFLKARTSTQTGTVQSHKEAYEKYLEAYPEFEGMSQAEFGKFWREATIQNCKKQYGSDFMELIREAGGDLTTEEVVNALNSVGFNAKTNFENENERIPIDVVIKALEQARRGQTGKIGTERK